MIIQYLFKENQHRETIERYDYSYDVIPTSGKDKGNVTRTITAEKTIRDLSGECWVVQFKIEESKKESAKHLSKIHNDMQQYGAFTLGNEASEYYNQSLYPKINAFEMRLRKFLFLIFSLKGNATQWRKIKDLEKSDLYTIYTRLFTSTDFNKKPYGLFPEKNNYYTKAQIQELIANIDEQIIWDQVVGDRLGIIKEKFQMIKDYRNDIMHSHNIGYDRYQDISKLFDEVNQQLSLENDNIVRMPSDIGYDEAVSSYIDKLLEEYGETPMSIIESWLKTSEIDAEALIRRILENN